MKALGTQEDQPQVATPLRENRAARADGNAELTPFNCFLTLFVSLAISVVLGKVFECGAWIIGFFAGVWGFGGVPHEVRQRLDAWFVTQKFSNYITLLLWAVISSCWVKWRKGVTFRRIGFTRDKALPLLVVGMSAGVLAQIIIPVLYLGSAYVIQRIGGSTLLPPDFTPQVKLVAASIGNMRILSLRFWGVVLIAPVCEEIIFRGILYSSLRTRLGVALSALISAGLFAAFHLHLYIVPVVFAHGIIAALLFERHKSLASPVAFHSAGNLTGFLIGLL